MLDNLFNFNFVASSSRERESKYSVHQVALHFLTDATIPVPNAIIGHV